MNLLSDRFWHRLINGAYFHCVFRVRFPFGGVSFLYEVYSSLFDWFQAIWLRAFLRFIARADSINTNDSMIRNSVDTFSLLYLWMWRKFCFFCGWWILELTFSKAFHSDTMFDLFQWWARFCRLAKRQKNPKNIFSKVNRCVRAFFMCLTKSILISMMISTKF